MTVHLGPDADARRVRAEELKNLGRDKHLYGVAPGIMRSAIQHAEHNLRAGREQRAKAQRRKKAAAAKRARRANRTKK